MIDRLFKFCYVCKTGTGNVSEKVKKVETVTIKDIAARCGVSVSTVSRVLNDHPDVSTAVQTRVLEVVKEEHYVPYDNARNLSKTRILLSIIPVIVFYLSCQKHIIKGVTDDAVKG